jgi:ferredoxin
MLANYGYKDGSGDYYITIDSDKCDGCGKCAEACPVQVIIVGEDDADPLRDIPVAKVSELQRKKIRYACNPCKTYLTSMTGKKTAESEAGIAKLPCVAACPPKAIAHSW